MNLFYLVLPPLIVFLVALTTQRVLTGLFMGIALASYQLGSIDGLGEVLKNNLSIDHLLLFAFILLSGWFLEALQYVGGFDSLFDYFKRRITNTKQAETTSLLLSLLLFFDGILSCLVVTSVLKPMTERFGIPPIKAAFLANAMGAPLTVLCPLSCLTILYVGLTGSTDVGTVFLATLPFCLYPLTLLVTLFFVVQKRWSFGLMKKREDEYVKPVCSSVARPAKKRFVLVPVVISAFSLIGSLLIWGEHTSLPLLLIICSFVGITSLLIQKALTFQTLPQLLKKSVQSNGRCLLVIFLAWLLADLLKLHPALQKSFAEALPSSLPLFFIPLTVFWGSTLVALALGTSWGAIAFLIPFFMGNSSLEPEHFVILGAILSGAAFGDLLSLVSDTTILASTRMGCPLVDLVRVQWQYALPLFIGCSIGFLVSGWLAWATPLLSIAISLSCFYLISRNARTKEPHQHYSHQ